MLLNIIIKMDKMFHTKAKIQCGTFPAKTLFMIQTIASHIISRQYL